jgi:hypothetical protein
MLGGDRESILEEEVSDESYEDELGRWARQVIAPQEMDRPSSNTTWGQPSVRPSKHLPLTAAVDHENWELRTETVGAHESQDEVGTTSLRCDCGSKLMTPQSSP